MQQKIGALKLQLAMIKNLQELTKNNVNFQQWHERTGYLLANILGSECPLVIEYHNIRYQNKIAGKSNCLITPRDKYLLGLEQAREILIKAIFKLDEKAEIISEINKSNLKQAIELASQLDSKERERLKNEIKNALKAIRENNLSNFELEFNNSRIVSLLNLISLNIFSHQIR